MSNNDVNKYELAYNKLNDIFANIYNELSIKEEVNPIEYFNGRIKKMDSIEKKLLRKGYSLTEENVDNILYDVVGFRIVCSFLSDVGTVINIIEKFDEKGVWKIIPSRTKDYIKEPKENGYSSYHIGIKVPVCYNDQIIYVNSEIQIRTIAMDMSNSLEHKVCYKKEGYSKNLQMMMRDAADFCNILDGQLNNVVKFGENLKIENISLAYPFMNSVEYDLFKSRYEGALKSVLNKVSLLKYKYDEKQLINPIEHIKGRIKNNASVIRKLTCKKENVTIENIENYVNDFAGVRVVCSFISEMKELIEFFKEDEVCKDLILIEEKDYVNFPKESGYRGYHMIVGVPVVTLDGITYVKVEIQIRTIAMEMWASLEEKIGYHKKVSSDIAYELKRKSSIISDFDSKIDNIYSKSRKSQLKVRKRVKS